MNLFKNNKRIKAQEEKTNQRGFTLIETLVAIFIMAVVVTGPVSFAQSGLRSAFLARDQVTAFYLAQDAIETIKNERDNNVLQGEDWLNGMGACLSNDVCEVDTSGAEISFESCSNTGCENLYFDESTKKYSTSGNNDQKSKFIRNIYMEQLVLDQELQVVVEIKWTSGFSATERRIVVQENIFNWLESF